MTCNKDQWIESFEGRLNILRRPRAGRDEHRRVAQSRSPGRGSHQGSECRLGGP